MRSPAGEPKASEWRRKIAHGIAVASLLVACGADPDGPGQPSPLTAFSSRVTRIEVEIDYAPGAEPYTDQLDPVGTPFALASENLRRLFAASAKDVVIPTDLSQMEPIDVPDGPYDGAALVQIAKTHRAVARDPELVSYYAVWLDGYYEKKGETDENVLGAALPDYGIVAIFKPAVRTTEIPILKSVSRFTEQSAFIHEMGHVLGLVDTGLPPVSDHEDHDHEGHCNNPDCVMFWANEGAGNLRRFAAQLGTSGSDVLFDAACLADAEAAAQRMADGANSGSH